MNESGINNIRHTYRDVDMECICVSISHDNVARSNYLYRFMTSLSRLYNHIFLKCDLISSECRFGTRGVEKIIKYYIQLCKFRFCLKFKQY